MQQKRGMRSTTYSLTAASSPGVDGITNAPQRGTPASLQPLKEIEMEQGRQVQFQNEPCRRLYPWQGTNIAASQ